MKLNEKKLHIRLLSERQPSTFSKVYSWRAESDSLLTQSKTVYDYICSSLMIHDSHSNAAMMNFGEYRTKGQFLENQSLISLYSTSIIKKVPRVPRVPRAASLATYLPFGLCIGSIPNISPDPSGSRSLDSGTPSPNKNAFFSRLALFMRFFC